MASGRRESPLVAGQPAAAGQGHVVKPMVLTHRNGRMPTR